MYIRKEADVQNLEMLFSKQATLTKISDGFVLPDSLKKPYHCQQRSDWEDNAQ